MLTLSGLASSIVSAIEGLDETHLIAIGLVICVLLYALL